MKKLEFETSKGRFVVMDVDYNSMTFVRILDESTAFLGNEELFDYLESFKLSEITEEQASGIVDEDNEYGVRIFQNYQTTSMQYFDEQITAIESLHSLLKSKGIYLFENPECYNSFCDNGKIDVGYNEYFYCSVCEEAEEKTFYNPYIFKLL